MDQSIVFDAELIRRYDQAGPRYTSYPTAVQFHQEFTEADYRNTAWESNKAAHPRPLSLYFHLPFCDTLCFYCACNKIATKDRSRAGPYLQRLFREITLQGALFDGARMVDQLHWGGGTPTFISHDEMRALMETTREHFTLRDDDSGEYSIEVDPRETDGDTIAVLREIGFNRISLGVQDLDPRVQKAVNRIQSEQETMSVLEQARRRGFKSVSIDLMYGLPFQTVDSFNRTLDKIIAAAPDRLSIFNYAHMPQLFKPQRRIQQADLPDPVRKLAMLQSSIERLGAAGYVYIGMDHFAKPDDELAVAQRQHTLYRNFQGYSTHAGADLIAMGVTSISRVGDSYCQNMRDLESYYQCLDNDRLAVFRGVRLDAADQLRAEIINGLICHFSLDITAVEQRFGIQFRDYFRQELTQLRVMAHDGLLALDANGIQVLPAGRLLIRNICMVFDAYMGEKTEQRFSKVI